MRPPYYHSAADFCNVSPRVCKVRWFITILLTALVMLLLLGMFRLVDIARARQAALLQREAGLQTTLNAIEKAP